MRVQKRPSRACLPALAQRAFPPPTPLPTIFDDDVIGEGGILSPRPLLGMRARFAVLVVLLAVLSLLFIESNFVTDANAQIEAQVETLTVSLLPQFNDPRLLIIYEAQLNQAGSAALAIPSAVELHRATYQSEEGELIEIEAEFEAASDGRFIGFTSPNQTARLELYQDVIPRNPQRFIDFILPAQRYDLQNLRWVATFPLDSSDIITEPPMTLLGQNHFGMQEYLREAGPLLAGEKAQQTIEWVRQSDQPSFDLAQEENILANDEDLTPIYLGLGALFVIGFGMVIHGIWKLRQQGQEKDEEAVL